LRLRECVKLRVKDVDFERGVLVIKFGKGGKDRETLLPEFIQDELKRHIENIRPLYELDRKNNTPGVEMPTALDRKYPNAGKEWIWQWVFLDYDIRTIQELLGHSSLKTTMIYTHVAQKNRLGVKSPLDSFTPYNNR
jgi:site-specific recombinase XerD